MRKEKKKSEFLSKRRKSTQKTIPIERAYEDGIMKHGNEYSVCFEVADINFSATSDEHRGRKLLKYEEIFKAIPEDVNMKVVLMNRLINEKNLKNTIFMKHQNDGNDEKREEINTINQMRATEGQNRIVRERYILLSFEAEGETQAKRRVSQMRENLNRQIAQLKTTCKQLTAIDRLKTLQYFFRPDAEDRFRFSFEDMRRTGSVIADYIAPESIVFPWVGTYFKVDDRFGRALMIRDFPAWMDDHAMAGIMGLGIEMFVTADFTVMTKDEALRMVHRRDDAIREDIARRSMRSTERGNLNAGVARHLREEENSVEYLFDCIEEDDQMLLAGQAVIVHMADSLEKLNTDTEEIRAAALSQSIEIGVLRHRQERGLNTALPYGIELAHQRRILSSENAAFMGAWRTKDIFEPGGIVYGVNEISGNLIAFDRRTHKNGNAFVVGESGSGKGVIVKCEMAPVALNRPEDDLIILDPNGEYGGNRLIEWLGGQTIRLSATSTDHINIMDFSHDFKGGDDPVTLKCEFLSGFVDLVMRGTMTGAQRSLTDRCVYKVLNKCAQIKNKVQRTVPTLVTLYDELKKQKEDPAQEVALALELYAKGSLNVFAKETNVNIDSRIMCYDLSAMSAQMRPLGVMVMLDLIDRRVARNRKLGKHTWVWCDEIWTLLNFPQAEEYLWGFWKRCRQYGGIPTGITQNLNAIARAEKGREMLATSEFVFMMGMDGSDQQIAQDILGVSADQVRYLNNPKVGHGLIRAGGICVPVNAEIPLDTQLYEMATTKIGEVRKNAG